VANCGEYSHQMIEYRGLFDLKDAQVLRAEIVSIDTEANTAEVTLLDTCEPAAWINLGAVPFFYHCEDSTGTTEDLARGHLAFAVDDMVYLLAAKENGGTPAQAYIIGHVDIRGTERCNIPEYLIITLAFTYNSTSYSYDTIFDTSTGAKLDLDAFENLDESSPSKPTSLPASSSSISSWKSYNFEAPTAPFALSGTFSLTGASGSTYYKDASGDYESWLYDGVDDDVAYTGQAYALCSTFSTGNATSQDNYSLVYTGNNNSNQPVDYSYTTTHERDGVTKYELGDTYCRAYWTTISITKTLAHTQDKHSCGTMVSGGTTYTFWWESDSALSSVVEVSNSGTTTEIESSTYSYSYSFSHNDVISCATFPALSLSRSRSWSSSVTGTLAVPPVFDATERQVSRSTYSSSTSSQGAFPAVNPNIFPSGYSGSEEAWRLLPWQTTMSSTSNCFKVGQIYIYGLIGFTSVEYWYESDDHARTVYVGNTSVWPTTVVGEPNISGSTSEAVRLIVTANATVTRTDALEPFTLGMSTFAYLHECLSNTNAPLSAGLSTVIEELFNYMITQCAPASVADSEALVMLLRNGPTAVVRRKKEV
jgi:hypothetical protein